MKLTFACILTAVLLILAGCSSKEQEQSTEQIPDQTQEKASEQSQEQPQEQAQEQTSEQTPEQPSEDPDVLAEAIRPAPTLAIMANGKVFYADLEDNPSAEALVEKLSSGSIEVELHDYGNFEKVGSLPWELPRTDESITTVPGDVILYQGNQITIYYDKNTWDFTRLARIGNVTREDLLDAFGEGNVTVEFHIERSEREN